MPKLKKKWINTSLYRFVPYWNWGVPVTALILLLSIYLHGSNRELFYFINEWYKYTGPFIWANLTILGDSLVAAAFFLPWLRRRPDIIWAAVIASFMALVLSHGMKHIFTIQRPPGVLPEGSFNVIGEAHRSYSFPSGHTTTIFTIAGVFILSMRPVWIRVILIFFSLFVGMSRIVAGIHWPTDILGGIIIGWLSAHIGLHLIQKYRWGARITGKHVFSVLLLLAGLTLLVYHDTGYSQAVFFQHLFAAGMLFLGGFEYLRNYIKICNTLVL